MENLNNIFLDEFWFTYVILPLLIFLSRVTDVTIGTLRIVMISRGQKLWAPLLGFFEIIIWLIAITRIMQNLDNWICYIAYGGGFATGNYVGLIVEEKLAMGNVQLQIITKKGAKELISRLRKEGFGITFHEAQGAKENVHVIYSIVKRTDLEMLIDIIRKYNPNAFYSISDVKFVNKGVYAPIKNRRWRKGK